MIIRLVHLTIESDRIEDFLDLFEQSKDSIRAMPGCLHLTLLQDVTHPGKLSTLSHWVDEDALNAYRDTPFFRDTWTRTKAMFSDRAAAASYTVVNTTD